MGEITLGKWKIKTPAVCASVVAQSSVEAKSLADSAIARGANLVEIRLDAFKLAPDWDELGKINAPVILTNRSKKEGGRFGGDEQERVAWLLQGIERIGACVDIEFSTSRKLVQKVVESAKSRGTGIIISHHDFRGTPKPESLLKIATKMEQAGADVVKIVTMCRSWKDVENLMNFAVETIKNLSKPVITFGMSKEGLITRYLSLVINNPVIYAAAGPSAAPGQPDLETVISFLKEIPEWEVKD
ncbi:MAG: type I 3-dehydroquinate dehydratase [Candidatus Hadarchaeales archaeon]